MTTSRDDILKAAAVLLGVGIGLSGYDDGGDEFSLPTPEAAVAYDRLIEAKFGLNNLLGQNDLELRVVPKPERVIE